MTTTESIIKSGRLNYSKYGLGTNPFAGSVPRNDVEFVVPRGEEIHRALWTLRAGILGTSTHAVVVGGYGNGKTHLLKYLKHLVSEEASESDQQNLAIYVHSPGENFRQLYSTVMSSLGHHFVQEIVWRYLGFICLRHEDLLQLKDNHKQALRKDGRNLKKIVEKGDLLLSNIVAKAKDELLQKIRLLDYATAILHLVFDEYSFLAWKWLTAEDMPYDQRKELGLSMSINNDERALRAFLSLQALLKEIGYGLLVLLIDEFEVIISLPERNRQKVLNEIRHLIDSLPSNLCIFLACAPEAWRIILEHYHAFLERFTHTVFLTPLNLVQTEQLIIAYLNGARRKADHKSLDPFSSEAIELIHKMSAGNVRATLKLCQIAVDLGLMHNLQELRGEVFQSSLQRLLEPPQTGSDS